MKEESGATAAGAPLALPFERFTHVLAPMLERVGREPQRRALSFIQDDGVCQHLTLAEVHAEVMAHANALRALGIRRGDVVVLMMGHSRALIASFLGALGLGAVPTIFPYLTEKLDPTIYAERVRALVGHAGARAVITGSAFREQMAELLKDLTCQVVGSDDLGTPAFGGEPVRLPSTSVGEIAYLQYTSGTSGLQKGIPNTHGAVLRYIGLGTELKEFTTTDVLVSWLPLYHDLGLVTGLLIPLTLGMPTVLMSPFRWVRDPVALFRAVHEFRGTITYMPNFALNHCVQGIRERDLEGLDLSRWKNLCCGGEAVRFDSQQQFLARFARCGFREGTLQTGYGMAENVCAATTSVRGKRPPVDWIRSEDFERRQRAVPAPPGAPGSVPMVSCGPPFPGTELRVVDDDGRALAERCIGEITLRGQYLFGGYYRRPDLTAEVLCDGWFHTGDLGYLAGGELYVCGRKNDLIIVGGRNLYPDDLEALAGTVPGVVPGRAVAFGIPDEREGTERVVLVCEVKADLDASQREALIRTLRQRAARELDIALGDVRLVGKGWVIKTSNGKIAHATNRQRYLREIEGREGKI